MLIRLDEQSVLDALPALDEHGVKSVAIGYLHAFVNPEHELRTAVATNSLRVTASTNAFRPTDDSTEHHFKEHQWGFGKNRHGKLVTYEVGHPVWDVYPVASWDLDWDWADAYGPAWSFLADLSPVCVILAAGSDISVHKPTVGG